MKVQGAKEAGNKALRGRHELPKDDAGCFIVARDVFVDCLECRQCELESSICKEFKRDRSVIDKGDSDREEVHDF